MHAVTSPPPIARKADSASKARPWWREPMVWLVIAGPVAVVIAGFVTLGIAIRNPDPVVPDTAVRAAASEGSAAVAASPRDAALTPAVQARNQGAAQPRPAP